MSAGRVVNGASGLLYLPDVAVTDAPRTVRPKRKRIGDVAIEEARRLLRSDAPLKFTSIPQMTAAMRFAGIDVKETFVSLLLQGLAAKKNAAGHYALPEA